MNLNALMSTKVRLLLLGTALIAGLLFLLLWMLSLSKDPLASAIHDRFKRSLEATGSFAASDAGLSDLKFFCVCGPYQSCEQQSAALAREINYSRPEYKYHEGIGRLRQKVLLFTTDRVIDIEIAYGPIYFAREYESYCSKDINARVRRLGGN